MNTTMEHEFRDGRIYVRRTEQERARLTDRLKKIEGQVRGIQKMIDEGRYCLDEIQQANAIVAAMREVEVADHIGPSGSRYGIRGRVKGQGGCREGHDGRPTSSYPEIGRRRTARQKSCRTP
jgi:CsoR family transcriptional regulator, copper-sensing transcriptional repressor